MTICVKNKECVFGEIRNGIMGLSELGLVANECWKLIPQHFKHVELDAYVIMPNHVHGIIVINNSVETQNFASLQKQNNNIFGPQIKNLGSVVRGFKIGIKKYATINNISFQWQPRFYDHIIRNEKALNNIRQYIYDNPYNWKKDRNNPDNVWI